MRKIIHVDMDAFHASIEQRDNPQLRVRAAMPTVRAQRLCLNAIFVAPDFARYRAVSRNVHSILERDPDLIEPLSLDEAYLDVTQNKLGLPTATWRARFASRFAKDWI